MYQYFLKRIFDVVLSGLALICLAPVLLVIAFLVKIKLGSPVLFTQIRPGKDNKLFKMYKFRSMTDARDEAGNLLSDDIRLTSFGKKLRATSLDELPELINIFKGDMSIVGPRPQLVRDMVFFLDEEMLRQSVYPGLTGLAQINGRNNISWKRKFHYDLQYISNISFVTDIKIIYDTVFKVANKDNINTDGMETAEDYGVWLVKQGKLSVEEHQLGLEKAKKMEQDFIKNNS